MVIRAAKSSPQFLARKAAILYLSLIPLGIFGILYVPSALIVAGDAVSTANNIVASESLFRLSIVSALLVQIVNIFLVLVLYKLLKPVNKNHALIMTVLILVAVPIAMLNELNNLAALLLLSGADYLAVFEPAQLQAQMMLFLELHNSGIFIAQIFWGLWLFPMGYMIFKSAFIPKIIGIALIIGCFGYVIDSATHFLLPEFGVTFSEFTAIGELLLPLWLLIKGVDVEQWEKRALKSG